MIQMCSILKVVDNSGAKTAFWISSSPHLNLNSYNYNLQKKVSIRLYYGGETRGSSLNNTKHVFKISGVNKKLLFNGLIVRQKRNLMRFNGSFIKFSNNSIILLDPKKEDTPLGTRIFGVVNKELRLQKRLKIISLASCLI